MKDIFQKLYDGVFRFAPLKRRLEFRQSSKGRFPLAGFLTPDKLAELEKSLDYKIQIPDFFEQALIHRSYLQVVSEETKASNERLEFLGDAALGMIVAEYLFLTYPDRSEGFLTKKRASLVNKKSLAFCARKLDLDKFVMLSFSASKNMENGGDSILADALEAVIAAVYLDSGAKSARSFVIDKLIPILEQGSKQSERNYKSELLEKSQASTCLQPTYSLLEESGPDHEKTFVVGVYIGDRKLGEGTGRSKKEAEQFAAKNAIETGALQKIDN